MSLSEKDLAEIEARANAATRGPWKRTPGYRTLKPEWDTSFGTFLIEEDTWARIEDVEFIAAARTDIPMMLADLREARNLIAMASMSIVEICGPSDAAEVFPDLWKRIDEFLRGGDDEG